MSAKLVHPTREQWLEHAVDLILGKYQEVFDKHFGADGQAHLDHLKVSTGFPSRGGLTKVIGECWKSKASADEQTHHIFINPRLIDPVVVIATLAHEMVHAADDGEHKHKGPFLRACRDMGLEGKATATVAGAGFAQWVKDSADALGEYPHTELVPLMVEKKQTTRMKKLEADCCGYIVRTTEKWLEIGMPSCPCGNPFTQEEKSDG